MTIRNAATVLAGVLLAAGPARAEGARVVVVPLVHNLTGDAGPVVASIEEQVTAGLVAAGYEVVTDPPEAGCVPAEPTAETLEPATLGAVASACGVETAMGLFVEASGIGYAMRMSLADAEGLVLAGGESACDFCAEAEMVERWAEVAAVIPPAPEVAPVDVAVGPVEGPVEPPGSGDEIPGDDDDSGASIADVPWWFWAGEVAALGAIGAGVAMIVIDGDITCDGRIEDCPDIYDTDVGGYVATGLGAAAAVALGIGLYFVLDDVEAEPESDDGPLIEDLAVSFGPTGFVVSGVFGP